MSALKELRMKLCLTQEEFAGHLKTSRVQYAQAKSGTRSLPKEARKRFLDLAAEIYTKKQESGFKEDQSESLIDKKTAKIKEGLLSTNELYKAKIKKLRSKLGEMENAVSRAYESKRIVSGIKEKKMEGRDGESLRHLEGIQQYVIQKKLDQNNRVEQALLEAKIELLEAKVMIAERLLKKLNL